jgi:hypothetical protein
VNRPTVLRLAGGVPVAVLLLAGCGGGGSSTSDTAAAATAPSATSGAQGGAAGRGGPAASGEIAAVSGKTLQVQNTSSQTAVTWSASTTFTKSVKATLAAGDCVTAIGTPGTADTLTASSVRVLSSGGNCTFDRAGRPGGVDGTPRARPSGGFGGGGRGGTPSSGAPGGGTGPSGAPGGGGRDVGTAFGTVTSVSGSTVLMSGTLRSGGRFGGSPGATPTPSATPSASAITVTLGSSASVLATAKATGADAKVGTCATATGKTDSTGTVAATAIALSPKGANGCTAGFGRLPGGGLGG